VVLRPAAATGAGEVTGLVTSVRASAEHEAGDDVATNVVDGSSVSKWLAFAPAGWLEFGLAQPASVRSYALMSAGDLPDRDPATWTLLGSDDGRQWTRLDRRTGQRFTERLQTREFPITNTTAYRQYRLDVTGNGGSGHLQLAQVRLFATTSGGFFGHYQPSGGQAFAFRGTPIPHLRPKPAPAPAARSGPTRAAGSRPAGGAPSVRAGSGLAGVARRHPTPELSARWIALLRPAIGLDPAAVGPVTGQLGGLPRLPADVAWPVWTGRGPLSLIASIDFGALPPHALDIPVPASGTLHFFYFDGRFAGAAAPCAADDIGRPRAQRSGARGQAAGTRRHCFEDEPFRHGGSRLVYVPAGVPVDERRAPEGLPPYQMRRLRAQLITPHVKRTVLAGESWPGEGVFGDGFVDAVHGVERGDPPHGHQLGGYSNPEQWPPESLLSGTGPQASDGGVLLARFGSDDRIGMQWGVLGSLYWVIKRQDLAEGRFEAAAFQYQCC
jgi:hypothetical protein